MADNVLPLFYIKLISSIHDKHFQAQSFVSTDGGRTWNVIDASSHRFRIMDHGGILMLVPTEPTNSLRYSLDEGELVKSTYLSLMFCFSCNLGRSFSEFVFKAPTDALAGEYKSIPTLKRSDVSCDKLGQSNTTEIYNCISAGQRWSPARIILRVNDVSRLKDRYGIMASLCYNLRTMVNRSKALFQFRQNPKENLIQALSIRAQAKLFSKGRRVNFRLVVALGHGVMQIH